MDSKQRADEKRAVEHAARFYAVLSKHVPVTTTVAELIVLTEVAKGVYSQVPTTVSEIATTSGISRWSVSRIVTRYIEMGSLIEQKDPKDSRRNLLLWTDEAFSASSEWAKDWLALK